MAISEITIDTIEPFADGKVFGAAGSYIRIKGIAKGEINPLSPENHVIADLDKAPRNAVGMVEYETFLSSGLQSRSERAGSWSTT